MCLLVRVRKAVLQKYSSRTRLFQQVNELSDCQIGVVQELAEQPRFEGFVVRYSERAVVRVRFVTEADVASSLPNDLIANTLESLDRLASRYHR